MTLGELIAALEEALETADPEMVVPVGFANPHSYRGYYDELAFEPAVGVTVGSMLACAKGALGSTYTGWKGGDYVMQEWTNVWLSRRGEWPGEGIGPVLLHYMIEAAVMRQALAAVEDLNDRLRQILVNDGWVIEKLEKWG